MTRRRRTGLKVAPFIVDVTPPIGYQLAYVINKKIDSRIYVRGIVIDDGMTRAVLASADYIGLVGYAYRRWKRMLARASGAPESQVLLHGVHQHDSLSPTPPEIDQMVKKLGFPVDATSSYWKEVTARLGEAVTKAVRSGRRGSWQNITRLATAERRLSGLASNRRLLNKEGKVWAMRFSMCSNPKLQREPVGRIDPILRTIAFLGTGSRVISTLHFYATHPQVAYHRDMVGSDVPGLALKHLDKAVKGKGLHIYFTGCGGDITFGKYAYSVKKKSLAVLGKKLGQGLAANVKNLQEQPLGKLSFSHTRVKLPLKPLPTLKKLQQELKKASDPREARDKAQRLIFAKNRKKWGQPRISLMSIGPNVHMVSLPSECVVEYQLYAQDLVPDQFLACAAYGEYGFGYMPTAKMYKEGGYEPKASICTPQIEKVLKTGIAKLLPSPK